MFLTLSDLLTARVCSITGGSLLSFWSIVCSMEYKSIEENLQPNLVTYLLLLLLLLLLQLMTMNDDFNEI